MYVHVCVYTCASEKQKVHIVLCGMCLYIGIVMSCNLICILSECVFWGVVYYVGMECVMFI